MAAEVCPMLPGPVTGGRALFAVLFGALGRDGAGRAPSYFSLIPARTAWIVPEVSSSSPGAQ